MAPQDNERSVFEFGLQLQRLANEYLLRVNEEVSTAPIALNDFECVATDDSEGAFGDNGEPTLRGRDVRTKLIELFSITPMAQMGKVIVIGPPEEGDTGYGIWVHRDYVR